MHSQTRLVAAAFLLLLAAICPALTVASASTLNVDGGVLQHWTLPGPDADLSDCGDLADYDEVVYGTEGSDTLTAGNGNQILVGLGGDDILRAGNQADCLLGGDGNDQLFGENGRDILHGGSGVDKLSGGSGKDRLNAGGDDGDECVSEGAPDELIGCGLGNVTAFVAIAPRTLTPPTTDTTTPLIPIESAPSITVPPTPAKVAATPTSTSTVPVVATAAPTIATTPTPAATDR